MWQCAKFHGNLCIFFTVNSLGLQTPYTLTELQANSESLKSSAKEKKRKINFVPKKLWLVLFSVWDRRKYAPKIGYFPSVSDGDNIHLNHYFPSETDGNKWPQNAIFRLSQTENSIYEKLSQVQHANKSTTNPKRSRQSYAVSTTSRQLVVQQVRSKAKSYEWSLG